MAGAAYSYPVVKRYGSEAYSSGKLIIFNALAFSIYGEWAEARRIFPIAYYDTFYKMAANYIISAVLDLRTGWFFASKAQRRYFWPLAELMNKLRTSGSEDRFNDYADACLDGVGSTGIEHRDVFLADEISLFASLYDEFADKFGFERLTAFETDLLRREYVELCRAGAHDTLLSDEIFHVQWRRS